MLVVLYPSQSTPLICVSSPSPQCGNWGSQEFKQGHTQKWLCVYCQWTLNKILFSKFTLLNLAHDGLGQLKDKLHLDEEKVNHSDWVMRLIPTNPHSFPSPLQSSSDWLAPCGCLHGAHQVCQVPPLTPWIWLQPHDMLWPMKGAGSEAWLF